MHDIAQCSFEPVVAEFAVILHVANGEFDGVSALDYRFETTRDAESLP